MSSSGFSRGLAPRRDQRSGAAVAHLLFPSLILGVQRSHSRIFLPPTTRRARTTQGKPIRRKGEVEQVWAQCTLPQQTKKITKKKGSDIKEQWKRSRRDYGRTAGRHGRGSRPRLRRRPPLRAPSPRLGRRATHAGNSVPRAAIDALGAGAGGRGRGLPPTSALTLPVGNVRAPTICTAVVL